MEAIRVFMGASQGIMGASWGIMGTRQGIMGASLSIMGVIQGIMVSVRVSLVPDMVLCVTARMPSSALWSQPRCYGTIKGIILWVQASTFQVTR